MSRARAARRRRGGVGSFEMWAGLALAIVLISASHGKIHAPATAGGAAAPASVTGARAAGAVTVTGPAACGCQVTTMPGKANEQLADRMAAAAGISAHDIAYCLNPLWTYESADTWSATVANPTSGAYGIPQALPAGKMAAAGADWQTNPATQITWGILYLHDTYGGPCGGWAHELSNDWY